MSGITAARFGYLAFLALGASPLIAGAARAQVAGQRMIAFNLPERPAAGGIAAFARASGMQLLARADAVRGLRTNAVRGRYDTEEALRRLLRGTGLVARTPEPGSRIVVVEPQDAVVTQATAPTDDTDTVSDIVVTGSNIAGGEITSPVTIITAADIARSGYTTPDQLVRSMTQVGTSSNAAGFGDSGAALNIEQAFSGISGQSGLVNQFAAGSGINLRGLGEGATLILVNGRRLAAGGSTGGASTDISGIPLNAIERIEILPNSASAIYGADAVAGVVNIILKKNYTGVEISGRYGLSSTLADDKSLAMNAGFGWGTGNVLIAGSYRRDEPVLVSKLDTLIGDQRPRGGADWRTDRCAYGAAGPLPVVILPRVSAALPRQCLYGPDGPGVGLRPSDFIPAEQAGETRYTDFRPVELTPRTDLLSFTGTYRQELVGDWSLDLTALWSRRDSTARVLPSSPQVRIGAANPFNPFGRTAVLFYDFRNEIAAGLLPYTTQSARFTSYGTSIALNGTLFADWKASVQTSINRNITRAWNVGITRERVEAALLDNDPATALNFFGDGSRQNPATLAGLVARTDQPRWISEERQLTGLLNGTLVTLPMGAVKTAVGTEFRRPVITRTSVTTSGVLFADGTYSRGQKALFAETQIPLAPRGLIGPGLQGLTLTLAGRQEWYDAIGQVDRADAFTKRIGLAWGVLRQLTLRGQYSTSFRVPDNPSLFAPQTEAALSRIRDPKRGNQNVTYTRRVGGNPNLDNQDGKSWSGGASMNLFGDRLTGSVDYWRTDYNNLVYRPVPQEFIALEDLYPSYFRRAAPLPGETVGVLEYIDTIPINAASFSSSGLDIQFGYRLPTANVGDFRLNVQATEIISQNRRLLPNAPLVRLRGDTLFGPAFSSRGTLEWSKDVVSAMIAVNYKGPTRNSLLGATELRIAGVTTADAQLAVRLDDRAAGLQGLSLSFGATNLFDRKSPFLDSDLGIDFNKWDPRGRVVYLALSKALD